MAAYDWDASWTVLVNGASVTNGSTNESSAIAGDGKLDTEVSIEFAYGGTATQGVDVQLRHDIDGTNYQGATDLPFGFRMPATVSSTHRGRFKTGPFSSAKIAVVNNSGSTGTLTVRYKQAVQ